MEAHQWTHPESHMGAAKVLVLESPMMINDDYTSEEVISNLLKVVELLDQTEPREFKYKISQSLHLD